MKTQLKMFDVFVNGQQSQDGWEGYRYTNHSHKGFDGVEMVGHACDGDVSLSLGYMPTVDQQGNPGPLQTVVTFYVRASSHEVWHMVCHFTLSMLLNSDDPHVALFQHLAKEIV